MTQYIIRRLLQMIPITLGILTLIFSLIHLIPGDPAVQIAGEGARPQQGAAVPGRAPRRIAAPTRNDPPAPWPGPR